MSAIRNAFVLGAGLGTRLKSLTARLPKPLIPICNKPLITFAFDHLIRSGVTNLVVNTHHCHEAYARFFPDGTYRGLAVQFAHEVDLLETAGGIKNVEPLLKGEPFVVYNGDILCDLPLDKAIRHHFDSGSEITMILRSKGGPLKVALDRKTGRIADIAGHLSGSIPLEFLFTGIYIVNPEFFARIPEKTKISVIPIFLEMIRRGERLGGLVIDEGHWWDLGTREEYLAAHRQITQREFITGEGTRLQRIHPSASIDPTARISERTAVGANSVIGGNASITDCILWENAHIAPGSILKNCIITAGSRVDGTHADEDF